MKCQLNSVVTDKTIHRAGHTEEKMSFSRERKDDKGRRVRVNITKINYTNL